MSDNPSRNQKLHALNLAIEERFGVNLSCFKPDGSYVSEERFTEAVSQTYQGGGAFLFGETTYLHADYQHILLRGHHQLSTALWLEREGEKWQKDIENVVAVYQTKPRDFAGSEGKVSLSIALCFEILIAHIQKKLNWRCMMFSDAKQTNFEIVDPISTHTKGQATGRTACEAIARAFLEATEPRK